ncbi:CheY-like/winged-helix domain-containing response regulator [Gaiella occulta]|uniref:CheY-like/winged-helix domain-containing response regulator n=1 Tax=Gaiella occulta TaxID=1002870 RepID=A0A7M2YX05_9ACTN|nr:response regulator transcription factor [Gaiella occulta]RDI73998.1 CheY-like/winged-helix domain-containing response regulator [Gaiella occulta]
MARILVAEDEPDILESVVYALGQEGFEVDTAATGQAALDAARATPYDVLVLDVMMPELSGLDVCRVVRSESDVPIVMLTARDAEIDRVLGLELGADDYVTKPFSLAELVSRVRALLRRRDLDRQAAAATTTIHHAGITIDLARHTVLVGGESVHVTHSEFRVLSLLASRPGQVFSRREIMEHLWQSTYVGDARACDVHIANLRRKLEPDPAHPTRIVTVREAGYRLGD